MLINNKHYLFIISHMRSYSSLLAHILGSNQEISGYAEMMLTYNSTSDFIRLRYYVSEISGEKKEGRFIMDKVLHNKYYISPDILQRKNLWFMFLLRKPEETLKSIIKMGNDFPQAGPYSDPEFATNYYCERLDEIIRYAKIIENNALFIKSENLLDNPSSTLNQISDWLKLKERLSNKYNLFEKTGAVYYGDPTEKIKAGKIIQSKTDYGNIKLPHELLEKASKSYLSCKAVLSKYVSVS